MYFSPDDSGRVLVVFRNGQTKVAFVPMSDGQIISELSRADIRMEYAQPAPGGLFGKLQERVFEYGIPGCLILGVVLLVKSWYKSRADADDRKKIREMELQEKKDRAAAATQERTESLQNAVREKEKRRKEQQAQGEEEEGEADPLASATSFLSTTAQVTVSKYQEFGNRIGFPDVAGLGEARAELEEIVTFLRNPERFESSGCTVPKGILLVGPPGTGKTLLARATAGEAGVTFFRVAASEFVEMFVGVGASRVRDLFSQARQQAPAIIFIDELDAVGKQRGSGIGSGNAERDSTVNQLLTELDGFGDSKTKKPVVVMAATNRVDTLDSALLRAGRFDRKVYVGLPSFNGRREIFQVHVRNKPVDETVMEDIRSEDSILASSTPGMSGADISNIVNLAAINATRGDLGKITLEDFFQALDLVQLGKIKQYDYSRDFRRRLAVVEAGKALVAMALPGRAAGSLQTVSIIPREGRPLGTTRVVVSELQDLTGLNTAAFLRARATFYLGSRAAEELIYGQGNVTSASRQGIDMAQQILQTLVLKGLVQQTAGGQDLPPRVFAMNVEEFLGDKELRLEESIVGPSGHERLDEQLLQELESCHMNAISMLRSRRELLDRMIEEIVERGILNEDDIEKLARECKTELGKFEPHACV